MKGRASGLSLFAVLERHAEQLEPVADQAETELARRFPQGSFKIAPLAGTTYGARYVFAQIEQLHLPIPR